MLIKKGILELFGFRLKRVKVPLKREKVNYDKLMKVIEDNVRTKKSYLDKNYSLIMLANDVGSNRTYVSKALKNRGMSFSLYINSFRIQYAMALMGRDESSSLTVGQIASMSGFTNERTMNYYLSKSVGITAVMFRARMLDLKKQQKGD